MTTIEFSGHVTSDALAITPAARDIAKLNLERMILAKESGTDPSGLAAFDLDKPLDERITWAEEANDEGVTITGTLEVAA